MYRKRKVIRTKIHQICKLPSLCGYQLIWGEVPNSWILNDIGRNSLLGNRRKIAKFSMSTFTYRSTFLYGLRGLRQWVQLYTGTQINFGDITPWLTYDFRFLFYRAVSSYIRWKIFFEIDKNPTPWNDEKDKREFSFYTVGPQTPFTMPKP